MVEILQAETAVAVASMSLGTTLEMFPLQQDAYASPSNLVPLDDLWRNRGITNSEINNARTFGDTTELLHKYLSLFSLFRAGKHPFLKKYMRMINSLELAEAQT